MKLGSAEAIFPGKVYFFVLKEMLSHKLYCLNMEQTGQLQRKLYMIRWWKFCAQTSRPFKYWQGYKIAGVWQYDLLSKLWNHHNTLWGLLLKKKRTHPLLDNFRWKWLHEIYYIFSNSNYFQGLFDKNFCYFT